MRYGQEILLNLSENFKLNDMILVFNTTLRGHYLEYFHHIYIGALHRHDQDFVFVYPEEDSNQLKQLEWPNSSNVTMKPISGLIVNGGIIKKAFEYSKKLGEEVKSTGADEVILTDIIQFIPFLPLFVHKTSIKGIRYRIYLYTWEKDNLKKHCADVIKCLIIKYSKVIRKVFVLADNSAAVYLNKKYKTNKFAYICDPIVRIDKEMVRDLRQELGVPQNKILMLHAGDLSHRKGTVALLRGLVNCDNDVLDKYYFLFAGRVNPSIKNSFDDLYERLQTKTENVKLISGFISFEYLGSLLYTSDLLLLNYLQTEQSSGFIGHAADFGKPVVVINSGLLGKIVRKYKLGYTIPDASPASISSFLKKHLEPQNTIHSNAHSYIEDNSIDNFVKTLMDE